MGWWEQIHTFDPPEDRYTDHGGWSRSGTHKEGSYSAKISGCTGESVGGMDHVGFDLSAYPDKAKLCMWVYVDDVTTMGASGYFRYGYGPRIEGISSSVFVYYEYTQPNLSTGWNFLSQPLDAFTNDSTRRRENFQSFKIGWKVSSSTDFYLDDVYITTDGTKNLDLEPTYLIKHFERYNTTNSRNQEYAGILEPINFAYGKSLNKVGQATFKFNIDEWDDLPTYYDSVRIYRNGMCVWDGIAVKKEKNYLDKSCILTCLTSDLIFSLIFDSANTGWTIPSGQTWDVLQFLQHYTHYSDDYDTSDSWQQKGFGIDLGLPMGFHPTATVGDGYTIPKEEMVAPSSIINKYQGEYEFDYEMRPPMCPNFWYPQKGRTISQALLQDTHIAVNSIIENGLDIRTMCRAFSRGSGVSFVSTQSNTTAMNTYGRLARIINTQGKSSTEVQNAASEYVSIYKDPATIFDIELMQGGWLYPWDTGDTITCVVDGTEYSKRIYAMNVTVTQEGEKVGLKLQ